VVAEVLSRGRTSSRTKKGRSSPMHGTSSSYIASTLRATRLYIFMHILYQDTTNEYENKQDFFFK